MLAEHLLGKLSPGGSYVIDKRSSRSGGEDGDGDKTGRCECLCDRKIPFGDTGIGKLKFEHFHLNILDANFLTNLFSQCQINFNH